MESNNPPTLAMIWARPYLVSRTTRRPLKSGDDASSRIRLAGARGSGSAACRADACRIGRRVRLRQGRNEEQVAMSNRQGRFHIGVDVGGTFTDFYVFDETSGAVHTGKRPSTPDNPARAIIEGLQALASRHDIALGGLRRLSHGTTVGTNALIQRRGGNVAMVTTRGFRDLLEIGRQTRPHMYSLTEDHPPSLVERRHRFEIEERMGRRGRAGHGARRRRRRHGGGANPRERCRGVRRLPAVRVPQPRAREPRRGRHQVRRPAGSGVHLVRGPARVPRVRAVLHHGAERLSPAGAGALSGVARGRARPRRAPMRPSASTSRAAV